MVTPIDVSALLNTLIPIIFLVMIISVITSLVKEFRAAQGGLKLMVTPIDVNAIINTIIPIIFLVMIISVITSLVKEFRTAV